MLLPIDIETIPTQRADIKQAILDSIAPPGQYKNPDSIQKWMDENGAAAGEEKWRKTALDGTFGELLSIGWAAGDGEPLGVIRTLEQSEAWLLTEFFKQLQDSLIDANMQKRAPLWIGHFLTGFDLRFLWQRCVINGVSPSIEIPYNAKPWGEKVFDTCIEWIGPKGSGGSLDTICNALGYEGKGDLDGSKVWDYVLAGRYDEILEYVKDDVFKTRLLFKRMTFQSSVPAVAAA